LKTLFNKNFLAFAFSIAILTFSSCKERTVTPSLIPEIDNIHTFGLEASFFDPVMKVGMSDSVVTSDYTNFIAGIGRLGDDPFYGSVREGLFIQFVPPSTFYSFPTGLTLDSAVVILPYIGYTYGDTTSNSMQYYNLYRITENFNRVSDFYSFQSLMYDNSPVGAAELPLSWLTGTLHEANDTSGIKKLKISLTHSLASSIFNADNSKFISSGSFAEFFKGFYIAPQDNENQKSISFYNLSGSDIKSSARLSFYTHDAHDSIQIIDFPYNSLFSPYFTKISKDYTGTPSNSFVNSDQNRDSVLLQGFPGFYTDLTLRNIDKIPASIVNKAELVITSLSSGDESIYGSPFRLSLEAKDANGVFNPVADMFQSGGSLNSDGMSFVDGNANTVMINGIKHTQYKLNFPRELQNAMMAGKTEITLRIKTVTSYFGVFRFLGDGFNGPLETQLKTNIVYTKK